MKPRGMMIYDISERRVSSADNDQDNYSLHSRSFPANGSLFVGQYLGLSNRSRHILWVRDVLAIV